MYKKRIVSGILFGFAAASFWLSIELIYSKIDTLAVGTSSAISATIIGALLMPKLTKNYNEFKFSTGLYQAITITVISSLLAALFFSSFNAYLDVIKIAEASQNPYSNYHRTPFDTFFNYLAFSTAPGILLSVVATPFSLISVWLYYRFIMK